VPVAKPFVSNVLAGAAAALAAGAEPDALANGLIGFAGVPLRRELVGEVGGIRVVNDAMAGSPVKVRAGLETFADRSVILVAGGRASFPTEVLHSSPEAHTQLDALAETIAAKAVAAVLFGEGGELLRERLRRHGDSNLVLLAAEDLEVAERTAARLAVAGNVIVFAPTYYVPQANRVSFGAVTLTELARPVG
jgi:UDP-N-acetylmuramoylalanine--D-glutamate ligase